MEIKDKTIPVWQRPHFETGESERDFEIFRGYRDGAHDNISAWVREHGDT